MRNINNLFLTSMVLERLGNWVVYKLLLLGSRYKLKEKKLTVHDYKITVFILFSISVNILIK